MPRIDHPTLPKTFCYFNEITDWGKQRWQIRLKKRYNGKLLYRFSKREDAISFLHELGYIYE